MNSDVIAVEEVVDERQDEVGEEAEHERRPEAKVADLDLSANVKGYWPSSANVTQ